MIEDKLLILRFKHGSRRALARIYEKYEGYLLTLAAALLNDVNSAEDIVHDFFVSFAQSADRLKLEGSLKGYLATCVANLARDSIRTSKRGPDALDESTPIRSNAKEPQSAAVCSEELQLLSSAIARLPYEQREVVILHLRGGMKFRQIAKSQNVSINTVQSRYRYGLDKLRTLLDGEM
jgi:RNA polymerase sigma-70 factor (ECF subfamily)